MRRALALSSLALAAACGGGMSVTPPPACDAAHQTGCGAGLYCEVVASGSACFAPVLVRGTVVDPTVAASIAGARVVALDANRAPVSSVATSSAAAGYELAVHAARDASGRPVSSSITLRADAQGYQTFPGGIRPALPVDLSAATQVSGRWVVSGPLTALELLPLPGAGTGRIAGTVTRPTGVAAPLVVAEPQGAATVATATAIAGADGAYALFNLALGVPYVVKPYAQGVNWTASAPTVPGAPAVVDFAAPAATAAAVTGGLIYNRSATQGSDVTLVVESTYVSTLDRGDSPPGLTVHTVGNANYSFAGVPDGRYVVLAAFAADANVRDLSSGGMTAAPRVAVAGATVTPGDFKIVPAVELRTIGGASVGVDPFIVVSTTTPTFTWGKGTIANAASYRVMVFDEFGDYQLPPTDVAAVTNNVFDCTSCGLQQDHFYQLRILGLAQSLADLGANPGVYEQLTQTEDVLGVFTYRP